MSEPLRASTKPVSNRPKHRTPVKAVPKPTIAQRSYLARGLDQPGGKLPLFDEAGRGIDRKTVESCIERGWAEPWFANPMKPGWLVCKLTPAGYRLLGEDGAKASG
jgi:hypothetical protein